MKANVFAAAALALAVSGCATGYHSSRFTGGFDETALAPNIYRVKFSGNGFTSSTRAEELALLRSADLTLQKGFRFFGLADSRSSTSLSAYRTPTQTTTNMSFMGFGNTAYGTAQSTTTGGQTMFISKPSSTNLVVMFSERPRGGGMIFDAQFICDSIGPKYKATCGIK